MPHTPVKVDPSMPTPSKIGLESPLTSFSSTPKRVSVARLQISQLVHWIGARQRETEQDLQLILRENRKFRAANDRLKFQLTMKEKEMKEERASGHLSDKENIVGILDENDGMDDLLSSFEMEE